MFGVLQLKTHYSHTVFIYSLETRLDTNGLSSMVGPKHSLATDESGDIKGKYDSLGISSCHNGRQQSQLRLFQDADI